MSLLETFFQAVFMSLTLIITIYCKKKIKGGRGEKKTKDYINFQKS